MVVLQNKHGTSLSISCISEQWTMQQQPRAGRMYQIKPSRPPHPLGRARGLHNHERVMIERGHSRAFLAMLDRLVAAIPACSR